MIVRSLRLKNIRSYVDAHINFPTGAVLLSGDIGCGKTTILLAIEFAIFGIMKGIVSGTTLLRHGSNNGSVELEFSLGEDNVVIKRSLKRASSGVVQEPGSLTVNGRFFEGTPQELKARVLELVGYPEELLNKSKSLIFRYTVFTPQEEMKKILYESREERVDVLRRLFNIDKYKRVKDNTLNYVREMKSKISVLDGKLEVMPDKKKELEDYTGQTSILRKELEQQEVEVSIVKAEFERKKKEFEELETELDELKKTERDYEVKKSEATYLERQLERSRTELERTAPLIDELLKSMEGFDASKAAEMQEKLMKKKEELKSAEKNISDINTKRAEFSTKKNASENIIKQISKLDVCPTCKQKVNPQHISDLRTREQVTITACDNNLTKLDEFEKKFKEKRKLIEEEIETYRSGEREFAAKKAKIEMLEEKKERKKTLEHEIEEAKNKIATTKQLIAELAAKLEKQSVRKQEFEKAKRVVEEKREEKNKCEKIAVEKKTRLSSITQVAERLKAEISRMKEDEEKLAKLNELKNWLEEYFINLVDSIEKHIMARIHTEFNSFFQEWFSTLLEDETISIRLDDYFAPIIEQNGYETWVENLSGGEKTSVALAYRLALNRVINDFLSTIRTRDIIILDEPTEGFSTEQLDRVREVINQTNVQQVIIVSHEAKMESFVDSIIRVSKQGHESRVVVGG